VQNFLDAGGKQRPIVSTLISAIIRRLAGGSGLLFMDMIAEIRRRHLVSKESISSIARDLNSSGPTVRKHCPTQSEPVYYRLKRPTPMLGVFEETLETSLQTERLLPRPRFSNWRALDLWRSRIT